MVLGEEGGREGYVWVGVLCYVDNLGYRYERKRYKGKEGMMRNIKNGFDG